MPAARVATIRVTLLQLRRQQAADRIAKAQFAVEYRLRQQDPGKDLGNGADFESTALIQRVAMLAEKPGLLLLALDQSDRDAVVGTIGNAFFEHAAVSI